MRPRLAIFRPFLDTDTRERQSVGVSTHRAPRSSLYRMVNEAFGGRFAERLAELRSEGRSWQDVAFELSAERGVRLSVETLRSWARQLGIEGEAA